MATTTTPITATTPTTGSHPIILHPISTLPHTPTHAYLIKHIEGTNKKDLQIHDLSPHISTLHPLSAGFFPTATDLVTSNSTPSLYTLLKDNLLGTQFSLHDASGAALAEWKNPIVSVHLGHRVHIRFMDPEHKGTEVEGHLEGLSEEFTKDETRFIWEKDLGKDSQQILSKITAPPTAKKPKGEKLPVAIFAAEGPHTLSGLLLLNGGEIDPLICLLTLFARLDAPKSQERIDRAAEFVLSAVIGL